MKHILIIFFLVTFTFANIGKISTVVGDANIQRDNKSIIATVGLILKEKDIIHTKRNAKVQLIFKDNTVVTLGKNSSLDINEYLYDEKNPKNSKTNLNFFKGAFKTITGKIGKINREKFKLRTKNATVGIRGTIILGNQQVIACTQGGITVQSSGQFVQVDANELTIIKENQAPSKPKNITSNELTSLENQLEPDSQTQDSSSSSSSEEKEEGDNNTSESESNEPSNSDESSKESQNEKTTNESDPNEETSDNTDKNENSSNQSQDNQEITNETSLNSDNTQDSESSNDSNSSNADNNILQNEAVSNNTLQTQNALEGEDIAEGTAEEVAAQKQAEEQKVFVETTEEIKVATQEINDLKKNVQTAQEETTKTLETLPSTKQVTTLQTSSTTALTETKQEVNTAVDTLKEALNLNTLQSASTFSKALFSFSSLTKSSNSETKTPAQLEVEAQKALKDITDFIATQDSTKNQVALTSAKTKVDNAELLLKDSEAKLESAKTALQNAQNKGINSSLIDSIQKEVDSAQAAYDEVNTLYTNAKDLYDSKVKALNDLDISLTTAEEAVKQAKLLVEVDNMKTSLTSIKNANTNANTNKDLTKATSTESSLGIQNLTKNSDILSIKTKTDNAQTTTNNSVNTALFELDNAKTNNITDETLANISSLVTQTNTNNSLLSEANAIKSNVATSENLALLTSAKNKLDTAAIQLENTKTNFKLAENELAEIKKSLKVAKKNDTNSLITNEINDTVLSKAQADYDSALAARTQAQSAYDSAESIYNDRKNAYDNAISNVNSAQEAVNDAVLLGKLSELLIKIDNGSDAKAETVNYQTQTISNSNQAKTLVTNLIKNSEIESLKTNTQNAQSNTQTSVNTALTELQNATTNSITDETLSNISSLITQSNINNDLLTQANAMKSDIVTSENKSSLNGAKIKLDESLYSLQSTLMSLFKAEQALTDVKQLFTENTSTFENKISNELKTSLLSKAQADYDSALVAHIQAQNAYDSAKSIYNDRKNAYDNAISSVNSAQEAVNDAVLLGKLSELLTFMDNGNDSNLQTSNYKTNVINSKNETSTIVNTLPTEQEINNVKTNASNALNQTDSSISNALTLLTNSTNNSNVDATDISSLNSSASSTTTSNNSILSSTQTFKNSVENEYTVSLNNAQVKATLSVQQLAQTKTALDNTKKALTDFNNSITSNSSTFDGQLSASLQTSLKEKLENEVAQAQASYDAALIASNEAQALVEAKRIALNDAVNISIENAQEAVQKATTLEKLADMLEFVDNGNKASLNANTHKTITQTLINEAKVKINTLPTTDEINTVVSKSSSSLSGTNTTQTSLVTAINSAINSSNINSEALENLQEEVSSRRLLNNSALQEANTFKTKVEGEYKTILDEANLKVQSAYTSLENAEVELNNAIDAYDDMLHSLMTLISGKEFDPSEETIPEIEGEVIISNNTTSEESEGPVNNSVVSDSLADSLMAKLQSEVNKAKDAYDEAREAYENVKEDYDNKVLALNNAAQQSVNEAQESVDTLVLLDNLEDVLDALEGSKQAQLDVENEKFNAVTAKTNTDTAASSAQSLASNVDTYYNDAKNASTESSSASTNALNAYNIAGNSETEDVDIAYSVQTYKDQTSLARLKANLAKTNSDNAELEYNKVVAKIDDVKDFLNNSLGARDNAITKLDLLKAKLDSLKEIEQQIPTSATAAKQSAQDAITKAEALYTIALAHKNDAVSAYNQAKEIFDELDKDTLLANAKTAKDNAKQEYDDANSDATNVEDKFATAIQYAKDASSRVKVVLLSKVKKAYPAGQSETTLDLPNKVFELSGVKTNEKLAPSAIMNYKGHTQLGVFKDNENSSNAMFLVQADNLHEYFVGYSDPSNVNKTLFTYGSNDADNFLTSKVYVYKNFKTFKNDTNKFLGKENSRAYYNSALNSFTVMSNDIYKTGATKFVVGNKNTVNTIEQDVKFKSGSNTFIDGVDVTQGNGQNTFQGSVEQGLTQTVNNTKEDSSTFDEISASFLDTVSDAKTTSVNKVLQGQTSMISLSSGVTGLRNEEIELFISSNGNMIGGESNYSNGNVIMEFFGTTNTQTSYYINTDIWGVRQNPVEVTGKDKEGYLMAVPDGAYNSMGEFVLFDENDNPLTSDDDSSWGYWTGKDIFVDNGHNASISPKSTWVAGVRTATSDVQSIIDGVSQTLTFNGKVMGTIGVNDAILMDNTNKVKIDFEVGAGTKNMSGNMQFKSANSSLYNLDMVINSDDITTSGFAGKFQNAGTGTGNKGYLSGEYYGEGTIKSVGGSFQVDDARGVFKATKK